jgi:hypothetical protein
LLCATLLASTAAGCAGTKSVVAGSGPGDHPAGRSGVRLEPAQQTVLCEDVVALVQLAPRLWPGFELAGEGILINTGEELYAVGFREASLRRVFRTAGAQPVVRVACGEPFYRLAVSLEASSRFFFVFGRSGGGDPRLGELAGLHGDAFLYVELRAFDLLERAELRRTIIHEGAHLFLQGAAALRSEPEYCLPRQASTCGRAALELLYRGDPAFRRSVHRELCAASEIDKIGKHMESHARPEDVVRLRERLAVQLAIMTRERHGRGEHYGTTEIEAFWYALEGVPVYLEEVAERAIDMPYGFSRGLPETCGAEPPLSYFYPLSCGGILWYAADLLEESDGWKSPSSFQEGGYRELFTDLDRVINRHRATTGGP